jgi:GntR family transcriptional regulator
MQELVKEPIYQQLNQLLRGLVSSSEFGPGARFLTERQISERFGVSRATSNKALSSLVSEGLLEFRKGVGTFVKGRAMDYNLRALVSFTDEALAAGKRPATRVLRFAQMSVEEAPEEVPARLGAAALDRLYYVERLRLADGLPVILERRWISAALCAGLVPDDAQGSLYTLWTTRYGITLEGADQSIRAVVVRGADARALAVRGGSAGLLVTSVGYQAGGRPLWYERTLYRGDAYEFHNRLGGLQTAGRAAGKFLDTEPQK